MINESNFQPDSIAYIQLDDMDVARAYTKGVVENIAQSIHKTELIVHCDSEGFLVVSEIYFPLRWQCTIDGEPVETIKTNQLIRGVVIPAGDHKVEFNYDKSSYNTGKNLSIISLIIAASLIGTGYYKNRKAN